MHPGMEMPRRPRESREGQDTDAEAIGLQATDVAEEENGLALAEDEEWE